MFRNTLFGIWGTFYFQNFLDLGGKFGFLRKGYKIPSWTLSKRVETGRVLNISLFSIDQKQRNLFINLDIYIEVFIFPSRLWAEKAGW